MKSRLDYLVGPSRTCLLMGMQPPESIENAHCLRRELKSMDPDLFYSIENAIGNIIELPDHTLVRELHLDSTDNQDQLCATAHVLFDGRHGIGSGSWCLWFPEPTYLYYIHIFYDEEPIGVYHIGPFPRTYEHLPTTTQAQIDADAQVIAALGRPLSTVSGPSDDPADLTTTFKLDPKVPPSAGKVIVRSHLNPANVLAETTTKLLYRKKPNTPLPSYQDERLFEQIYPVTEYWINPKAKSLCTDKKPRMPVPDDKPDVIRSERIQKAQTARRPRSKATSFSVKKRDVIRSAPTVLDPPATTGKRGFAQISGASSSKSPRQRTPGSKSKPSTRRDPKTTTKAAVPDTAAPSRKKRKLQKSA
ncbi:uncharacterized protein SCHCODRAFT_02481615 [Schizophyllum commune H4-8]|uniref:uncharacterized protein n=1 Tax=Schizophyllum commune (strain H4-8 / FGSC 9210) TaxID=578458 RepID=UPI00215E0824|nr:uncharacterized protein SCHCODRAFT_02481615 [Schizophyllum commune H4-8]KAI5900711.1 hypothetical protein SCHCODRAFT_02481615 [Schizophyllum commune H4-8]